MGHLRWASQRNGEITCSLITAKAFGDVAKCVIYLSKTYLFISILLRTTYFQSVMYVYLSFGICVMMASSTAYKKLSMWKVGVVGHWTASSDFVLNAILGTFLSTTIATSVFKTLFKIGLLPTCWVKMKYKH